MYYGPFITSPTLLVLSCRTNESGPTRRADRIFQKMSQKYERQEKCEKKIIALNMKGNIAKENTESNLDIFDKLRDRLQL